MSERDKKITLALIAFVFFWLMMALCAKGADFPSEFHDPSLDSVNNNLTILDADLNGNFAVLNTNIAKLPDAILFSVVTNGPSLASNKASSVFGPLFSKLGFGNLPTEATLVVEGKTNMSGATNGIGLLYTNLAARASGYLDGTNIFNYQNPTATGVLITLQVPIAGVGPAGTLMGPGGRYYTDPIDMDIGSLGSWFNANLANGVRYAVLSIAFIVYFFWFLDDLKKLIGETLNQRQVVSPKSSVAGIDLQGNYFAGVYAYIATVTMLTLFQFIFSSGVVSLITSWGTIGTMQTSISAFLNSVPAWTTLTLYFPVWHLLVLHVVYLVSSRLFLNASFLVVRMLIFWMVS